VLLSLGMGIRQSLSLFLTPITHYLALTALHAGRPIGQRKSVAHGVPPVAKSVTGTKRKSHLSRVMSAFGDPKRTFGARAVIGFGSP
jgi:hypothetical protein